MPLDDELRSILLRGFPGCHIGRCEELQGGVSARAVAVDLVLDDGRAERVVVRRPIGSSLEETLRIVQAEYDLLGRCAAAGLPVPNRRAVDLVFGAVVLEYVEGAPDFAPRDTAEMLSEMASQLALIHRVPGSSELSFLPRRSESAERAVRRVPERLDRALGEARLRAVLSELWPWQQHNQDVLLHGDYWPGNLLWKHGKLAAVLDWEEAELGDPLADVALSRLDVLWAFGETAMHTFTERYRAQTQLDWRNLARWDLCVALRPMSNLTRWATSYATPPIARPDITELSMAQDHRRFVQQAISSLTRQD